MLQVACWELLEPSWKCAGVAIQCLYIHSSIWLAALLPKAARSVALPPISDGRTACRSSGRTISRPRHAENGRRQQALPSTSHFSPSHAISHCRSSVSPPRSILRVSHNPLLSPRHFCTPHQPPSPPSARFSSPAIRYSSPWRRIFWT